VNITVIILAAGKGKRMKSKTNKQYLMINNKPVLAHAIDKFEKAPSVTNIILVVGENEKEYVNKEIIDRYNYKKIEKVVKGGKERQDSVYNGINKISDKTDIVLIHDGARPLVDVNSIETLIKEVKVNGACILGVKIKDTIKVVDLNNNIQETPNREYLYAAQTPQGFHKDIIKNAYNKGMQHNKIFTDDSMIVEEYENIKVKIVEGNYKNIKITTQEDIELAEKYIED
jgi:2-C-methyl-D-erythritol 4-phosphate cytidylyltransferase